ncbi:hypothetical protein C2E23DRAFT_615222 [Lenzites betulinus]|nr:hypothetical protein C2E23DRAFT_615222 [Lenzites betulinus]
MLTPVIAAKHLRTLMPVFYRVDNMAAAISSHIPHNEHAAINVDILRVAWTGHAALELMTQRAIGCSLVSRTDDAPDPAYINAINDLVDCIRRDAIFSDRRGFRAELWPTVASSLAFNLPFKEAAIEAGIRKRGRIL